ncbi:hypothetical protein [Mariniblastus fucicola]|uniref:Uncharacterized protein n=1 Tax=Mariniblastus fucicola TaxID=980251 RepID=A0A5B9P7R9_9BACT|nr:hypothetical protein [Mariniblastus fucicola]QEG22697.1 hypothetical protein MFFC18_25800 [Mariniblastus fucicola]
MKFTITQMLYGMVVFAVIAAVIGAGANGSPLAYGLGLSMLLSFVYFLFFAALYWAASLMSGRTQEPRADSSHEVVSETES